MAGLRFFLQSYWLRNRTHPVRGNDFKTRSNILLKKRSPLVSIPVRGNDFKTFLEFLVSLFMTTRLVSIPVRGNDFKTF
jgi:hypothetical protein